MTLRFLDLTAVMRLLTFAIEDKSNTHHSAPKDHTWYQHLRFMAARARQRRQLLNVSDALLDDMGLTRAQVLEESNKPFWKA